MYNIQTLNLALKISFLSHFYNSDGLFPDKEKIQHMIRISPLLIIVISEASL